MRRLFIFLLVVFCALILGSGFTRFISKEWPLIGTYHSQSWQGLLHSNSDDGNPYAQAFVVSQNYLPIGIAAGLRLIASHDDHGHLLKQNCRYRLHGKLKDLRFWTLFAVNEAHHILTDKGYVASLESRELLWLHDGSLEINISSKPHAGNWLKIPFSQGHFKLILTLYDTNINRTKSQTHLMPSLTRIGECS